MSERGVKRAQCKDDPGISYHPRVDKYEVKFKRRGVTTHVGYFSNIEAARSALTEARPRGA
jgi:hypothetical protein